VNYAAASDPNHKLGLPYQYMSKVNFHNSRLKLTPDFDNDGGGSVEAFGYDRDMLSRAVQSKGPLRPIAARGYGVEGERIASPETPRRLRPWIACSLDYAAASSPTRPRPRAASGAKEAQRSAEVRRAKAEQDAAPLAAA
jgi:hypothetical protein